MMPQRKQPRFLNDVASMAKNAQRRTAAMEMRIAKIPYSRIAEALGYTSANHACTDVQRCLADARAMEARTVDQYREEEMRGLDAAQAAIWAKVKAGDISAIDCYNRIVQTRAKLLGLFAPTTVQMLTIDVVELEIARLEAQLDAQKKVGAIEASTIDGEIIEDDDIDEPDPQPEPAPPKARTGRPRGSKNKPKPSTPTNGSNGHGTFNVAGRAVSYQDLLTRLEEDS